jgi:hypothetical protein
MAVTIKLDPELFFKEFNLPQGLLTAFQNAGGSLDLINDKLTLHIANSHLVKHLAFKAGVWGLVKNGQMGYLSKQHWTQVLTKEINEVLAGAAELIAPQPPKQKLEFTFYRGLKQELQKAAELSAISDTEAAAAVSKMMQAKLPTEELGELIVNGANMGKVSKEGVLLQATQEIADKIDHEVLGAVLGSGKAPVKKAASKDMVHDISHMMKSPPVKLENATQLYQPVRGSDASSRYFMVGRCGAIKVGVRSKGGKLSVRVEGGISTCLQTLKEIGFGIGNGYASFHVDAKHPVLVAKVVGGVLASLPGGNELPPFDVNVILNKGT